LDAVAPPVTEDDGVNNDKESSPEADSALFWIVLAKIVSMFLVKTVFGMSG
jgi:hypothetical protein